MSLIYSEAEATVFVEEPHTSTKLGQCKFRAVFLVVVVVLCIMIFEEPRDDILVHFDSLGDVLIAQSLPLQSNN